MPPCVRALREHGYEPAAIDDAVSRVLDDPQAGGVELFYPLCFSGRTSLLDYLGEAPTVFLVDGDRLEHGADALRKEHLELFRRARSKGQIVPQPARILLDYKELMGTVRRSIDFPTLAEEGASAEGRPLHQLPCDGARSFFGNFTFFREEVEGALRNGYAVFVFAEYDVQAERLRHILKDLPVEILPQSISAGFGLQDAKILAIQEAEIFGRKRRIPRSVGTAKSSAIESFVELNPGDFVVHVNHGIGVFSGIQRISAAGNERDYITLEYADGEKLFIPIEQVNLIQRYIGHEGKKPRLDSLGGRGWQNRKEKARKAVEELAQGLLDLYSRRKSEPGFAFQPDTDWQSEFEAAFPYQETEDQLRCIEEVKRDMESPVPMDRLVCGDVGYGKTEIALRAAFKAVMSGKQVALLAPTTILVEQHYDTFRERFARFPVKIAMLSRFRSPKEMKSSIGLDRRREGGHLHRHPPPDPEGREVQEPGPPGDRRGAALRSQAQGAAQADQDHGGLPDAHGHAHPAHPEHVPDEGSGHVHPEHAPQNRLPIETHVTEFNDELVARAIRAEIDRGGQIFYLHNRVETIREIHLFLQRLVPEVSVAVGHGQMEDDELEEVMRSFVHGERQLLLTTTIIENGLDIPNVNTIIIDRADMFGVSQLYQLRGRVGRAGVPAYAYLLYPDRRRLSELVHETASDHLRPHRAGQRLQDRAQGPGDPRRRQHPGSGAARLHPVRGL